jgi:hypothetical protein
MKIKLLLLLIGIIPSLAFAQTFTLTGAVQTESVNTGYAPKLWEGKPTPSSEAQRGRALSVTESGSRDARLGGKLMDDNAREEGGGTTISEVYQNQFNGKIGVINGVVVPPK